MEERECLSTRIVVHRSQSEKHRDEGIEGEERWYEEEEQASDERSLFVRDSGI